MNRIITVFLVAILSVITIFQTKNYYQTNKTQAKSVLSTSVTPTRAPLTIESIFYQLPKDQKIIPTTDQYDLMVTGDVIPARSVNFQMTYYNDFTHPFKKTADFFDNSDMVLINLESPLIDNCPITNEGMIFCGNPHFINGLKMVNTSIVNIANNHFENYGQDGVSDTLDLLKKNDIEVIGLNNLVIKKVKDKSFGFLGFNFITGGSIDEENNIKQQITDLRKKVDFLVVMYHWGDEYTDQPNQEQRYFAHLSIDLGTDLVLGNHPHWIQAMEIYQQKPIVYSHGNFIFDQMWSQKTREGIIGHYVFDQFGVSQIYFYPIIIENYNQPRPANRDEAKQILDQMKTSSL